MLNNILKKYPVKLHESRHKRMELFVKSHTLAFNFRQARKTGVIEKKPAYNYLFYKFKGKYYTPITHFYEEAEELKHKLWNATLSIKFSKYYENEYFKNIDRVHILGDDPYLALPHALAFWPDYDLLKAFFKNIPLEKVDETFWAKYIKEHFIYDCAYSPNLRAKTERRLDIFGFVSFIMKRDTPLIYKDGALLTHYKSILKDISLYDKPTIKEVINAVLKYISKHREELSLLEVFDMFPYTIIITPTDYGVVLNMYKYNFETLATDLVLVKPLPRQLPHIIPDHVYTHELRVERVSVKDLQEFDNAVPELPAKDVERFGRIGKYAFGIDDEKLYVTVPIHDFRENKSTLLVMTTPLKEIETITVGILRNSSVLAIKSKKGETALLKCQFPALRIVIRPNI